MSVISHETPVSQSMQLDLTALNWCLGEIHASLNQVVQAIQEAQTVRGSAVTDRLRMATGSAPPVVWFLSHTLVVGGGGIPAQIEHALESVARGEQALDATLAQTIERTCTALMQWLSLAARGTAVSPLDLFEHYRNLLQVRGVERVEASDLFHVRLIQGAPKTPSLQPFSGLHAPAVQGAFERGLPGFPPKAHGERPLRCARAGA